MAYSYKQVANDFMKICKFDLCSTYEITSFRTTTVLTVL